ncbi:hypothetical protein [Petroclostridium sp. X23]|uniref:hypothetical protein n=1 Tax=Petroclostridium sp. X23 TaxID=3045146 RepID=UPI0024AD52FF|nr:hypothetical protein [Petroclostridium sp. X23]WHH59720.1 hypothetical protein QKW49_02885 [Petroclostridium sp. X23]
MKKKAKLITIILSCIAFIAIAGYLVIGDPVIFMNNQKLENSFKSFEGDTIKLNEAVPFDWDIVYTFEPYASKESIEEIVGFKSAYIKENNINEGMVHLLFVKDKKVVASVLGYSANLGYSLSFSQKIEFNDNAVFTASNSDGVINLIHAK